MTLTPPCNHTEGADSLHFLTRDFPGAIVPIKLSEQSLSESGLQTLVSEPPGCYGGGVRSSCPTLPTLTRDLWGITQVSTF